MLPFRASVDLGVMAMKGSLSGLSSRFNDEDDLIYLFSFSSDRVEFELMYLYLCLMG